MKNQTQKDLRLMTEGSMFLHVLYHDIYPKLWNLHLKLFTLCLTSALLKYAISRLLYCIKAEPKVSLLGVDSLWGDCMLIPADWDS